MRLNIAVDYINTRLVRTRKGEPIQCNVTNGFLDITHETTVVRCMCEKVVIS